MNKSYIRILNTNHNQFGYWPKRTFPNYRKVYKDFFQTYKGKFIIK